MVYKFDKNQPSSTNFNIRQLKCQSDRNEAESRGLNFKFYGERATKSYMNLQNKLANNPSEIVPYNTKC